MNNLTKNILCVIFGAVTGSVVTGLLVRRYYEDILIQEEEEYQKSRKALARKFEIQAKDSVYDYILKESGYEPYQPTQEERQKEWAIRQKALREAAEQMMVEEEYPGEEVGSEKLTPNGDICDEAYDPKEEYEDEMRSDGEVDEEEEIAKAEQYKEFGPDRDPYLITESQFTDDYPDDEWEKESIDYYAYDDIIADTDDSEFDVSIIGRENLHEFERTDCPSIFIRNERLKMDYEILWTDDSYAICVLGEDKYEPMKWLRRPWEKE